MLASKLGATTFALPKSTVPVSPLVGAFTVTFVSPFLITKSLLPSPEISFILARFAANFTSKPSPAVFFTTLILFLAPSARVKFSAPLIVKVVPKSRCTLPASVVSLPVKSKPFVVSVLVIFVVPSLIFWDKSV